MYIQKLLETAHTHTHVRMCTHTHTRMHTHTHTQLKSAVKAVEGETAVVIANGMRQGETILDSVRGKPVGTFITRYGGQSLHMQVRAYCMQL